MALLIALLAGAAIFLLAIPAPERPTVSHGPWSWSGQDASPSPAEVHHGPVVRWLADLLVTTKVARNLAVSGSEISLDDLAARKLRLTVITLLGAVLLWLLGMPNISLVAAAAGVWAFQGPDLEIARKADARRMAVQRDLPFFLFTLAVLTEAGLHLLPALEHYCRQAHSTLAEEMKSALAEIQLGQTPALAFLNLSQQLDVRDFTLFVGALVQSMEKGTDGLSLTLRSQAEAAWDKRRRVAQELGAKASVKLFLPLVLFVLPSILAMAAGPAVYNFITQFFGP